MNTTYFNGKFIPLSEVCISAMDRGFLFGDGVYEVIPVYNGHAFRLEQHLQRLAKSLSAIQLILRENTETLKKIIHELIETNGGGNQSIYLQCTRGAAPIRNHAFPDETNPTVFAYSAPLGAQSIEQLNKGIAAITVDDIRWQRCDIKAITLLPNVLLRQEAVTHGAQEAILINNGFAIEGSAMNLFVVKNNTIITPPISTRILGGITRDVVLELAIKNHYLVQEKNIPVAELAHMDEIWVTSSSREIVPVVCLNNKPVADGKAGPLWHKMIHHYRSFKENYPNG